MPQTGLYGSYSFNAANINAVVKGLGAGAYALGYNNEDGSLLYIQYIGRSDTDLNARLLSHIGENYKHFQYAFFDDAIQAYNKECWLYHTFNPPDNDIHPAKPEGTNCKCPFGCL